MCQYGGEVTTPPYLTGPSGDTAAGCWDWSRPLLEPAWAGACGGISSYSAGQVILSWMASLPPSLLLTKVGADTSLPPWKGRLAVAVSPSPARIWALTWDVALPFPALSLGTHCCCIPLPDSKRWPAFGHPISRMPQPPCKRSGGGYSGSRGYLCWRGYFC